MLLYRLVLAPSLPAELPADAATHAMATLGGAAAVASTLPAPGGDALLAAARAAFADALQFTAAVGAGIILLASFVSERILRAAPGPSGKK
jgi:DHA2 family multidrug resistance protein-like MFS transporter